MPQFCTIVKCGRRSGRDKVSFHRFPSIFENRQNINPLAEKRPELWIQATRRADLTTESLKWVTVCSKYFIGDMFKETGKHRLHKNIFLFNFRQAKCNERC